MIAVNKFAFDGRVTRKNWYPKWILFGRHTQDFALIRRTSIGQVMCDTAIDLGFGIPIARRHDSVCDAMKEIEACHTSYCHAFYFMLMSSNQDEQGWVEFLKVVANHAAYHFVRATGRRDFWLHDIQHGVSSWYSWYIHNRQYLECDTGNFGFEFLGAIRESFIHLYMMMLLSLRDREDNFIFNI